MNPGRSTARGFTLLELMIVLVLIGVVTALILPEMKGTYEEMLLRSTGRTLVTACALASSQAVTANQRHRLRLDRAEGKFVVERFTQRGAQPGFAPLEGIPGGRGVLDKRIVIELHPRQLEGEANSKDQAPLLPGAQPRAGADDAITFNSDGTSDGGELILRDREGFALALRINPTTSRVRIRDGERR